MMFYQAYNQFGVAFRIFPACMGRSDQVVIVVLVIFTNTSNDIGCRFEPLPVECGGGRWRATGWSQPLTSPSPSAPEVRHRCTTRLSTATPPSWSSSSPRAPPWMLRTTKARGPRSGRWWGRQGVECRDDLMQSE